MFGYNHVQYCSSVALRCVVGCVVLCFVILYCIVLCFLVSKCFVLCCCVVLLYYIVLCGIDPLHIVGMQPIWGTKQNKFSLLGIEIYSHVKKILLFCPPDWLHSHRCAEVLLCRIALH